MPVPYTPDAVKAIRFAVSGGQSRSALRAEFGWDDAMLDRICRRHGIDLAPIAQEAPAAPAEQTPVAAARAETAAVKRELRRLKAQSVGAVTVTFHISLDVSRDFQADVDRRKMTRGAVARRIITVAVDRNALADYEPEHSLRRPVAISTQLIPSVFDALCARAGTFGSMSALCGEILHKHYTASNVKRSVRL